ncbi:hypothetical protein F2Q69_00021739 [Brassica cretica]|uniref:Uncharacterized protein n=1 Tax=Brassica cretica TaxID=69181 RepID=A0A8S9QE21_BRACR|nr:hypothetical protein F2Q69_00021739 [Brassica cretica]
MSSVLKGSRRLAPISTHRSGDASSRQTVTTGVGNLRQRWYVDGMARMVFNHGVPMITL